jgi:hypothetical protein
LRKYGVRSVLDRLHKVLGVKNDSQLCEGLQVSRSTVGSWIARESVPYAICVDVAQDRGISLDWLLTGEGPMHRGEEGSAKATPPAADPREAELLGHFGELEESAQLEVLGAARLRRRVDTLERQLQELQATVATLISSP